MEIKLISKYRKENMGIATILIMFFHTYGVFSNPFVHILKAYTDYFFQIGVEMFLFLSGFGLYVSYKKDNDIKNYYKKRFVRIIPTYLIAVVIYCICLFFIKDRSIEELLYDKSLISFFVSGKLDMWFISSIILLYIFFPIFYYFLEKKEIIIKLFMVTTYIITTVLSIMSLPHNIAIINEALIVRIPCFIYGMIIAKKYTDDNEIQYSKDKIYLITIILLVIFICNCVFNNINKLIINRIIFMPLTVCLILINSFLINLINCKYITKAMSFYGGISLEIYMFHEMIQTIIIESGLLLLFNISPKIKYIISIILIYIITTVFAYIISIIIRLINKNLHIIN